MRADIDRLREEISALDDWIHARSGGIHKSLLERRERFRTLLRVSPDSDETRLEKQRIGDLKSELDSINEARQLLALKTALLQKLETGSGK